MAIDRKYIFDKVMFFLKKESKFFTSSEIHMMIGVDAFKRIAEDLGYPKTNVSVYMTSGQHQVSAPSGFLKVDENSEVTYKDSTNTHTLDPAKQTSIGRGVIMTATPGTPTKYYMVNESQIGVYPPSTSGCIVIPYIKEPTNLSSDSDTNELTSQCYMAAAYWVVQESFRKDNDQRGDLFETKYMAEITRLRGRFGEMYEIDFSLSPHSDYLG